MASFDSFLKIDGIEGESQDSKHKGEIELLSYSWGAKQSGTFAAGGGGGAGKVNMDDFEFTMHVNKASPKLMLACASGQHIPKAVLTVRKAGTDQQEFLNVVFSDILVSYYGPEVVHKDNDPLPVEEVHLNFAKVEFEYKEQKADGTLAGPIKAGWDLKLNKKV